MSGNSEGVVCFHQGWTDIINQLPLINWYLKKYERLYVFMRQSAMDVASYYTNAFCTRVIYIPVEDDLFQILNLVEVLRALGIDTKKVDLLFHGNFDMQRSDTYYNVYCPNFGSQCFVKAFYTMYDIPATTRINLFEFTRNLEMENTQYNNFIEKHGTDYILYHECPEVIQETTRTKYVSLGGISSRFLDMIKVLEGAKEIHVIDSVWATIIYLLQARYNLFANIPITVYCKRGYVTMYTDPVRLHNWKLVYTKEWLTEVKKTDDE